MIKPQDLSVHANGAGPITFVSVFHLPTNLSFTLTHYWPPEQAQEYAIRRLAELVELKIQQETSRDDRLPRAVISAQ